MCSVAVFDADAARPFRSTIPGKEPVQVGRWHAFRKREGARVEEMPAESTGVDWESVWARKTVHELPAELQDLR